MSSPDPEAARSTMARLLGHADDASLLDPDRFAIDGQRLTPQQVLDVLAPHLTESRQARIAEVVSGRTYTVVPVVEGLINTGNVSAVMRSAEGLGYQGFHIITGSARYKRSQRTTQGADKWLDVWQWTTPAEAAAHLKDRGYRIVATHLDETAVTIDELDFTERTALVFGNERDGVSEALLQHADARCIIPMEGFVQSFNISVAAAVSLYHARQDRLRRQGHHGDLSEAEQTALRAVYALKSVKHADRILARWLDERQDDVA